jgi:hypothetical protein
MNKTITYLHSCNAGDLIGALAGVREIYRKFGKKAIIYQELDVPGHYMPGLVHSVKDDQGTQVTMNKKMFDMAKPLLLAQEYVEDFLVYNGEKIEVDLNVIRESILSVEGKPSYIKAPEKFANIPNGALPGWPMLAFPPMACDISQPWIDTPGLTVNFQSYILINRTERYLNKLMNYSFLKKYEKELLFTGTEREHFLFCKEFDLNFPRLGVDNFLELAEIMKMSLFFLGNQSFPWNLANAMGVPRIVEMFSQAPNCQPFVGKDNYGSYRPDHIEYYFDYLYNQKKLPPQVQLYKQTNKKVDPNY